MSRNVTVKTGFFFSRNTNLFLVNYLKKKLQVDRAVAQKQWLRCITPNRFYLLFLLSLWFLLSLSLSLTLPTGKRCSLTHFPDVHSFPHCTHPVVDLQLREQGWGGGVRASWDAAVYSELMRHTIKRVSIGCEPLLLHMFCLFPSAASIFMERGWLKSYEIKTKRHWFPLLALITGGALIGMQGSSFLQAHTLSCRVTHTHCSAHIMLIWHWLPAQHLDFFSPTFFHLVFFVCKILKVPY